MSQLESVKLDDVNEMPLFLAEENANLQWHRIVNDEESNSVVNEAEQIVAEAAAGMESDAPLQERTMSHLIETWALAEKNKDTKTVQAVQDIIQDRIIDNELSSDAFKLSLIDRYYQQKEEAKAALQEVVSEPLKPETIQLGAAAVVAAEVNEVNEVSEVSADTPVSLREEAKQASALIADAYAGNRELTDSERSQVIKVAERLDESTDIKPYVHKRILRAYEHIKEQEPVTEEQEIATEPLTDSEATGKDLELNSEDASKEATVRLAGRWQRIKERFTGKEKKSRLVKAGAVIGGLVIAAVAVTGFSGDKEETAPMLSSDDDVVSIEKSQPSDDPIKPIKVKKTKDQEVDSSASIQLKNGDSIWESSREVLKENGIKPTTQNTARVKNAVLRDLGLTEAGAHFLPRGFEYTVPDKVIKNLKKSK